MKFSGLLLLFITFLLSCQKVNEGSLISPAQKGSARYDLQEVTVTASRLNPDIYQDIRVDVFSQNHSFEYAFNPYRHIREYAGDDDVENIPGFLQAVLRAINSALEARHIKHLNENELAILSSLPVQQVISYFAFIIAAEDFAKKAMTQTFTNQPEDNGYANAFKHVYFSYITTKAFKVGLATDLLNAHETGPGLPPNSSQMDNNNNSIGIGIANGCCPGTNLNDNACETLLNMAKNGSLWTLQNPYDNNSPVGHYPYIPAGGGGPTQGIP